MDTDKSKCCGKCIHRRSIPGDCHISCANAAAKPKRLTWPGCGLYPINFDSNTIQSCDGYSEDMKDYIEGHDPISQILRLLGC